MRMFHSDEEYWAWVEKRARTIERLHNAARYAALMSALALLLFVALFYGAKHLGEQRQSQWSQSLEAIKRNGGNN